MSQNLDSSIRSISSEGSFLTAEAQALYLAPLLGVNCQSALQGLHRSYPQAWENRHQILNLNARYFNHGPLDYHLHTKMAYALFCYSETNPLLAEDLLQLMKRQFKPLVRFLHQQTKPLSVKAIQEALKMVKLERAQSVATWQFAAFGVLDYFVSALGFSYESNESFDSIKENITRLYDEVVSVSHSNKGWNQVLQSQDKHLQDILRSKTRLHLKAIEQSLGMNLVLYLRQTLDFSKSQALQIRADEECLLTGIFESFSHDLNALAASYPLQRQDLEQLIFFLTDDYRSWANQCEGHPLYQSLGEAGHRLNAEETLFEFTPDEDYLCYVKRHIRQAYFTYLIAKSYAQDQSFFFKMYSSSDKVVLDQLRKERQTLLKEKDEALTEKARALGRLTTQKEEAQRHCKVQTKKIEQQLLQSERENEMLRKQKHDLTDEVSALSEQVEALSQQLTELRLRPTQAEEESIDAIIERFNQPHILIVGGDPSFIHKLKQHLPQARYYEVDTTPGEGLFNGVESVFGLRRYMNHSMSEIVDKYAPHARRHLIEFTNIQSVLREMAIKDSRHQN